jgi:hypothetical protein
VGTPLLPTLVSSLQTPVVEGIMKDTTAVVVVAEEVDAAEAVVADEADAAEVEVAAVEPSWTLNAVSKDE